MSLKFFSLTCLLLVKFFIQPTTYALPDNIQNLELDDIISQRDKFPSLIEKLEVTVNRFRCPKGWKRLGGSCYYFSNQTSTSSHANNTCNDLHSNRSNLMQIRNAVELFYAAHVLLRNSLSSLMIDIDPSLLKGKKITEMLTKDQDRWARMKEQLSKVRVKYQNITENIVNQLNSAGLRILRRSRKLNQSSRKNKRNSTTIDNSSIIYPDEYEYDDFDSSDEFEQIDDIRNMCDEIHWNVLNIINNSTTYILTLYKETDKIVCSLSDVDPHTKYHHVCEYVLDFCFANIFCGKFGRCVNALKGFKCSCSFLFGGLFCETISSEGKQIVIGIGIIILIYLLPIPKLIWWIVALLKKKCSKASEQEEPTEEENNDEPQLSMPLIASEPAGNINETQGSAIEIIGESERRKEISKKFRTPPPLSNTKKFDLCRAILIVIISSCILLSLYLTILLRYRKLFKIDASGGTDPKYTYNITIHLINKCTRIYNYGIEHVFLFLWALVLTALFPCIIKTKKRYRMISPIKPFFTKNRLITATVFGLFAFEVLKFFEESLFNFKNTLNLGVLMELLIRILSIVLTGFLYYPIFVSLRLHNTIARCLACLHIIVIIIFTIVREGSCMGYLPLSGKYAVLEEAKLRIEFGSWFIIYGSIKNIPHFFLLSYIGAELCVRFAYDSIYIRRKNRRSIKSGLNESMDGSEAANHHVTQLLRQTSRLSRQTSLLSRQNSRLSRQTSLLFRQNSRLSRQNSQKNTNLNDENEGEENNETDQSLFRKLINYFYIWDDGFHFTTMVICTNTVAFVFLYYLACTFVFFYITRTTGHLTFMKSYVESLLDIKLGTIPFKLEIIFSAIFTVIIYGGQLLYGMKMYRHDRRKLEKGKHKEIPMIKYFKPSVIAGNSVHYSGFLVGYMAWGFVICFHVILLIAIIMRLLPSPHPHIQLALGITVPIIVIYFLKRMTVTTAGEYFFVRVKKDKHDKHTSKKDQNYELTLKNTENYEIFVYFMLFADCFIGIAASIFRLIQAIISNLLFMARIDDSFLGRPLDRYDAGYAAYISCLYMELDQRHRVKIAFCSSLFGSIQKQPETYYYDEEDKSCITADRREESKEKQWQRKRVNSNQRKSEDNDSIPTNNHNVNKRRSKNNSKTPIHLQKNDSSSIEMRQKDVIKLKNNTPTNQVVPPIKEMISTQKLQKSSITMELKSEKNSKQQSSKESDRSSISQNSRLSSHEKLRSKQDQTDDEIEDEDGGLKPKSRSKTAKIIPSQQQTSLQSSNTSTTTPTDEEEEDEDGSINSKRRKEHKQKIKAKKTGKYDSKMKKSSNTSEDFDDEDGALSKPKGKIKETKSKKKSMFIQCIQNQDDDDNAPAQKKLVKNRVPSTGEDEDGGPVIKTYNTIKKMILFKQPILKFSSTNDELASDKISFNSLQSAAPLSRASLPLTDQEVPDISMDNQKIKKNDYDAVPTEEEGDIQETTTKSRKLIPNKLNRVRRTSYEEAQENPPVTVSQRSDNSISLHDQNNTNDDHRSHYSEIRNEPIQTGVNNLVSAISHSITQQKSEDKKQILRKKRARTRWYLAYTIIRNPSLHKLRKKYLKELHSEQKIQLKLQLMATINSAKTEISRTRGMKAEKRTSPSVHRALPVPDIDNNKQNPIKRNIPLPSSIEQQARTYSSKPVEPASKIKALQQENMDSSITYAQTTRPRHAQLVLVNE